MSAAEPPQGASSAPLGGSEAAKPRAWADHASAAGNSPHPPRSRSTPSPRARGEGWGEGRRKPRAWWDHASVRVRPGTIVTVAYFVVVFTILLAPLVVVIGGSFSAPPNDKVVMSYVQFPPERLTLDWYAKIPGTQLRALGFSFVLGIAVACGACLLGVPAAVGLVRGRFPGKSVVSAVMRAPLQIPHVVSGIAFLQLFYAIGDFGGAYVQGTTVGLFIGHLFMATPFVTASVAAVLLRCNPRLEETAAVLGASQWRTFWRVTLPLILPGVFTGALYAFIVSFVDVPVAIFLASPDATTFPVELFNAMEQDFNPSSLASASLAAGFAIILVFAAQRVVGLDGLLKPAAK